jgi:diguanylate cyclase (GGDEF)-like protein
VNRLVPALPHERPAWREAPYIAVSALVVVLALILPPRHHDAATLAGVGVTLLVALGAFAWTRTSRGREFEILLSAVFLLAVALLRQGGGAASGYSPLVLVPVVWSAVYGTRRQLTLVIAGVVAVFIAPLALESSAHRPDAGWRLAVLLPLMSAAVGFTLHRLLAAFAVQTLAAERRASVLRARHAVTKVLAGNVAFETALPTVLAAIGETLGWPFGVFWRVHSRKGVLRPATVWQDGALDGRALRAATGQLAPGMGECLVGRAWRDRRPAWEGARPGPETSDEAGKRLAAARAAGLHGSLAFPVRHGAEVVGVVECFVRRLDVPDDELLELLDDLGVLLEQFIERVEHSEQLSQLETMARTEELTGLPNRRAWEETLPREVARSRRTGRPLCVVLLDLDHFKAYNDTFGHLAGDTLLREAARAWRAALRTTDFLARFGGDEFAALLPDCPLDQGVALVERLRTAGDGDRTVSVGLAQWNGTETVEELVHRADTALYQAKTAGRDRVELAAA